MSEYYKVQMIKHIGKQIQATGRGSHHRKTSKSRADCREPDKHDRKKSLNMQIFLPERVKMLQQELNYLFVYCLNELLFHHSLYDGIGMKKWVMTLCCILNAKKVRFQIYLKQMNYQKIYTQNPLQDFVRHKTYMVVKRK